MCGTTDTPCAAQQMGMDQAEAFQNILAGFMAELQNSTDHGAN